MRNKLNLTIYLCVAFIILTVIFPEASLSGAQKGLNAFLVSVLPALLPFFVGASILVRSGAAQRASKYLSSFMYPLFRLPGISAFAFLMSIISGYPNGAKITSELYSQKLINSRQAAGTFALASTSGPSFILGAVAAGMLHSPSSGLALLLPHYLSAIVAGFAARLLSGRPEKNNQAALKYTTDKNAAVIIVESIRDSATALWAVGAFVVFFSSLIAILTKVGFMDLLGNVLAVPLMLLGLPKTLGVSLATGFIEITSGCLSASANTAPLIYKLPALCAIISFGGVSILAQSYSYANQCGVKLSFLFLMKFIQGCAALFFCSVFITLFPPAVTTFAGTQYTGFSAFVQTLGENFALFIIGSLIISLTGVILVFINLIEGRRYSRK